MTVAMPRCPACGGAMRKSQRSTGNASGIALALFTLLLGLVVTFMWMPVSCFVGPMICVAALFMGGKREKIWRCRQCGSYVPRV